MTKFDDLAFALLAAGGAAPESAEGLASYSYTNDGSIIIKNLDGTSLDSQELVAEDAKPGSDAPLIFGANNKTVIYVGRNDVINISTFSPEEEEWTKVPLDSSLHSHPQGRLAAVHTPQGVFIFWQGSSGALEGMFNQNLIPDIPVHPAPGSPFSALYSDGKVQITYLNETNEIRMAVLDPSTKEWTADAATFATLDTAAKRIMTTYDEETKTFVTAALTADDKIIIVSGDSTEEIGKVVNGKFKPATTAECMPNWCVPRYPPPTCGDTYNTYNYGNGPIYIGRRW